MWTEYDAWNDAIAEVVYPELDEPRPVYLDLEGELLEEIGKRMDVSADAVENALSAAVSKTLRHNAGPSSIFSRHVSRMRNWVRGGRMEPPPFLALLATFCFAAEQMTAGDGMASNNYYGRLRAVLKWDAKDARLDQGYRLVAERLWGELNRWLVELDGQRGLPTALALSHRYVGLPVSQALIRSADHDKLKEFFRQFGFAPGADVPPSDLVLPFGDWISGTPSPVSADLQRLWKNAASRERIAEAVSVSLATWDGAVRERSGGDPGGSAGTLALTLELGGFPRKRFALSALFYVGGATTPRAATVLTADPPTEIDLVPDLPGALGLGAGSSLHAGDVLEGVLRIKDNLSQRVLERRPRRLIVFREDDLSRRWIEAPQVMLGDNVRLLVHEDLLPRLSEVLEQIARPGWEVAVPYPGQPEGWAVFTDVEVFSHPGSLVNTAKMDDLLPLVPLTSSQLKVAGGFALPGRVRGKWHSWAPPEIRAISDTPDGFIVRLIDTHRFDDVGTDEVVEDLVVEWNDNHTGVVVRSLQDLELTDGDYRVELVAVGAKDPLTTTSVLLRSSDTPDMRQWDAADSVGYTTGLGALGVSDPDEAPLVSGHVVTSPQKITATEHDLPASAWWSTAARVRSPPRSPLRITVPDANSCIRTGRHVELIETVPTDSQGRPLQAWTYGKCKGCGLVRKYPTRLRRSSYDTKGAKKETETPALHDLSALVPAAHDTGRDYSTAFDALLHTGGGTWSQLERIALQVEPTALFVDQFARNLEVLGHIDVRRDQKTLQPTHWEVSPTALVNTGNDFLFAGFWPNSLYVETAQYLEDDGLSLATAEGSEAPTQYFIDETTLPDNDLAYIKGKDVVVVDHAWADIVSILPPLSEILDALPRQSASLDGDIRWFKPGQATWVKVSSMDAPGAYRVRRFATVDVVRSPKDVAAGTVARSTVQLSKHVAAFLEGRPLLAYDGQSNSLLTPLGADLPALYGRAVVAASGVPPVVVPGTGLLRYHDVPKNLAGAIYDLMSR